MTQEEVSALAKEAGMEWYEISSDLKDFAELVAAKEREACALICDAVTQDMSLGPLEKYRASWLANEIRERGKK